MTATSPLTLPLLIPGETDIDRRFWEFHNTHPEVYEELARYTRQMVNAQLGRGVPRDRVRVGMKAVYERVRWEVALTRGDDGFRLNNDFTALFSRLLMTQEPDLAGVFETRRQSSGVES